MSIPEKNIFETTRVSAISFWGLGKNEVKE